mgnify:CR=1 FL=1
MAINWSFLTKLPVVLSLRPETQPSVLAIILPLFAWAALTYPGYLETHSGLLPVWNLNDLRHNLTNFSWAPVVGQPYDLLRGERFLPYMLGVVFTAFGAPASDAVKWVFGLCFIAGSLGMYGWARRRLGAWPALIAATIYTYLPVGLAATYVRGAFAVDPQRSVDGKKVLLVDDVYTSGATVNECSRTLKRAGAEEVTVLTLARAVS